MNPQSNKAADRIIELAAKWQDSFPWKQAYKAAEAFEEHRKQSTECWSTAKRMEEAGQQGEMLERFRHHAKRHEELGVECHRQVIAATQELLDLKQLVRTHAPTLLEYVPQVNFFDAPDADRSQWLRDLQTLEGKVRAEMQRGPAARNGADSSADTQKKKKVPVPRSADVIDLCSTLKRRLQREQVSEAQIARDFVGKVKDQERKAKNLLRQARLYSRDWKPR